LKIRSKMNYYNITEINLDIFNILLNIIMILIMLIFKKLSYIKK